MISTFSETPEFMFDEKEELKDDELNNLKELVDSEHKISFEEKEKLSDDELANRRSLSILMTRPKN